jgi:hypothetical protein
MLWGAVATNVGFVFFTTKGVAGKKCSTGALSKACICCFVRSKKDSFSGTSTTAVAGSNDLKADSWDISILEVEDECLRSKKPWL